jgi:glycosyltransferase involved in cell wall biosynthesis
VNQSQLGRAYAAADCLVLPSDWGETWGLVVNEAMATGLPCVVSDRVGCAPDLIIPGQTGDVFAFGDADALATAVARVRKRRQEGWGFAAACRAQVASYSHEAATAGLVAACQDAVQRRPRGSASQSRRTTPRVVACCGHMSVVYGLERMTFEVLRALRVRGMAVHCILNTWANWDRPQEQHPIAALAERIGASWSTGYYWYSFERRSRNPLKLAQLMWDILMTSGGLLREAWNFQATHVLVPEHVAALRNAPALLLLRMMRIPVLLRVANHPAPGRFYRRIWGRVLPLLVTRFVANSQFSAERLRAAGVPPRKIVTIRNAVARRSVSPQADTDVVELVHSRRTVLSVGQIAPFKGTHLVVEAMVSLLEAGEDIQSVIVGPLPVWPADRVEYARHLRQRVAAVGAQDRIHFVGERENVLEIMQAAYVFAAPILQEETFGNVALEAKSVGLPVVAFPTGGLPELVEHGVTGYVCGDSNLESLLAGLRYFLSDPDRRNKAAAASLAAMTQPDSELGQATFRTRWQSLFDEP